MMPGTQATMVSPTQERAMVGALATTRSPTRERVLFLWSITAGLRAEARASLTWAMITEAQEQVADVLHVPNRVSKGKTRGLFMHRDAFGRVICVESSPVRHLP